MASMANINPGQLITGLARSLSLYQTVHDIIIIIIIVVVAVIVQSQRDWQWNG
jgi:hypothetical protein